MILKFLVTDSNLKNEYRQHKLVFTIDPTRFKINCKSGSWISFNNYKSKAAMMSVSVVSRRTQSMLS